MVLALDGIDYRDMLLARERGLFAQFRTPSRMISTFPSISDIAWHEILGVQAPRGYQRIYFSNALQDVVGEAFDAIKPIEFEDRVDMAFGAKFHHLGAYLISNTVARREVDVDVRDFFKIRGRQTVYIYNVGPDALQHTNGDLVAYLRHLDERLAWLDTEYRRRTGHALEIVVLSDHGHNHATTAKFVPIERTLRAAGFRIAAELRAPNDVAFSVDGVTTGFGVFCAPESVAPVAAALAGMEGVELVSRRIDATRYALQSGTALADIDVRHSSTGDRYRYRVVSGDPLRYGEVVARMREEGALDADGFASTDAWRRYTSAATYPVAVVRLVRGHTAVTMNPAPILVSLLPTHRIGMGFAAITNRLVSLSSTHGSLSTASSLGVLMTNFVETHDDLSATVREQFDGFADLGAQKYTKSGGRLTSRWLLSNDPRTPFAQVLAPAADATPATDIEVWLTPQQRAWTKGTGAMYVELRELGGDDNDDVLATGYVPFDESAAMPGWAGWTATTDDRRRVVLPLSALRMPTLDARSVYEFRVSIDRQVQRTGRLTRSGTRDVAVFTVRTDATGRLWPY